MAGYIKFDGVEGESKDKDHKGWIDFESLSQGLRQPGRGATGAARRRGDVICDDIQVTKLYDKSSPKLAEAVCNGKVFPKVEVHFTASTTDKGRETFLSYEMKNVMVTSYNMTGMGQADNPPMDSFSLNFEEIRTTYHQVSAAGKKEGKVEYSWKVEEGEK